MVQCLSSDVLARLELGKPNLPDTVSGRTFRQKAAALEAAQKEYDDWDWNTLSSWIYMPPEGQLNVLDQAIQKLLTLIADTERLISELRRAPAGAAYDELLAAARRLRTAQLEDLGEHQRAHGALLGIQDRGAIAALIDAADTAYDHVGVPGDARKDAAVMARRQSTRKDRHSVFESMADAVDAFLDFVWYHGRRIYRALQDRTQITIDAAAPTRRIPIQEGSRGAVTPAWSYRVQITLRVNSDGTFRIQHFHPA